MQLKRNLLSLALAAAGYGVAGMACAADVSTTAADAAEAADTQVLESVNVTANRRVQSIQEYAGTIQSFTGEDIERLGVNTDFTNLQAVVPGLQITRQEGKYEIFLRGIGAADSDFSSDPSIATYYNGIYLPRPRSIGPMFFDVERIEVNKGPQGTVRGRNATGGSINIIPNLPELGQFGGSVKIGFGDYNAQTQEGVVNLPLGETLAVRAALYSDKHDSYYTNGYPSHFEPPGAIDNQAARVSVLWQPTESFSANLMVDRVEENGSGDPGVFANRALAAGYDIDDLDDPYRQYFRTEGLTANDIKGVAGTLTWSFDRFSVEYNGSWREYDFYNRNASREWQLGFVYPGSEREAYHNPERLAWYDTFYQAEKSSSSINELRFFGETDRLIWSAGGFFFGEKFDYLSWDVGNGYFGDCDWYRPGTICGWQDGLGGENRGDDSRVRSNAAYGDFTFKWNDDLRFIGGLRYTDDKKTARESNMKYQFVIPEELFAQFGLDPNLTTNPYTTGLILGSSGFQLRDPGGRLLNDPRICSGWSPAALTCNGGSNHSIDYFLDGIARFGTQDNWDDFLARYRDQIELIIRSDYPDGRSANVYKDNFVDWRAGFEYDIADRSMLYGTISTGTRSGGINRPLVLGDGTVLARTWKPEELLVYEVGSKNDFNWNGRPVRLNGSLFYYDYQNKVVQNLIAIPSPTPTNPAATTLQVFSDNAANAEVLGLEIEAGIKLAHGFDVSLNYNYLDSQFKDSSILDTRAGGQNLIVPIGGNRLPNTSTHNVNLVLSQIIDVEWGAVHSIDWTMNMLYRSDYYLTAFNNRGFGRDANGQVIEIPLAQMPVNNGSNPAQIGPAANGLALSDRVDAFAVFNLSAGMTMGDDDQFRLSAYIANVTDKAYSGKGFINDSVNLRYLNTPRTYGLQFAAKF
ncbi:TonB-dependent receptor [Tahibacter amnicola]|uniref:TonB-dependent receptor n=1 Tax=Tahibacter amnicola TaxID=2976241 RepID=A0ABY6BDM0_9GAMM|nr:TonB-dependent receptor [Tahibacter amnicola]UXI68119.1 TonB-dependent receptor [Tahibacter amnicola]